MAKQVSCPELLLHGLMTNIRVVLLDQLCQARSCCELMAKHTIRTVNLPYAL